MYRPAAAALTDFERGRGCGFPFVPHPGPAAGCGGAAQILLAVASTGDPWTFGIRPEALPTYLQQRNLELIEDLTRAIIAPARATRGRSAPRARITVCACRRPPDGVDTWPCSIHVARCMSEKTTMDAAIFARAAERVPLIFSTWDGRGGV